MRQPVAVALALLFVLAGVVPGGAAATTEVATTAGVTTAPAPQILQQSAPADPPNDTIGWERGYWHNESVDVDQSDGLSDAELEAYVARATARVEYLREREFTDPVPVEVISRERYRARQPANNSSATFNRWNDQVWEALFIVGESTGSERAIGDTLGSSVAGFYSPADDSIKIVTDSPGSPTLDNATLVHELVHALQDQQYNLSNGTFRGETQDGDLAVDGVVEGEANYIEQLYVERCGVEWDCVETPAATGGGSSGPGPNLGVLVTVFQPYSDGPVYVSEYVEEGGWPAFERRFVDPPVSTEQTIHLTDEEPVPIAFEDRAIGGWETFPDQGQNGSDTVGEASIYTMFWYQSRTTSADAVDWRDLLQSEGRFDTYDYTAAPSTGWGNDRLFPYRLGRGDSAEYGYVWVTEWDTAADAREFERAYESILDAQNARQNADGVFVVPSGEFADAFRVVRNGTRVTVVNGPTPGDVEALRPDLAEPDRTTTADPTTPTPADDPETPTPADDPETTTPTADPTTPTPTTDRTAAPVPGFGVGVALLAVLAVIAVALGRRRR